MFVCRTFLLFKNLLRLNLRFIDRAEKSRFRRRRSAYTTIVVINNGTSNQNVPLANGLARLEQIHSHLLLQN